MFNPSDFKKPPDSLTLVYIALVYQTRTKDRLDKLCKPCVRSKLTRVIRCKKSITVTTEKLEEVHADFWGPHNPPSQWGSTYGTILMCEYTKKTWTLYLKGKNNFVNVFQAWLSRIETELSCLIKVLQVDGDREFISTKLQIFYEKYGIVIKYATVYIHKKNWLTT